MAFPYVSLLQHFVRVALAVAEEIVDLDQVHLLNQVPIDELANSADERRKTEGVGRKVIVHIGHFP